MFGPLLSLEKAQTQAEKALLKDFVMLEIDFWTSENALTWEHCSKAFIYIYI